MFTPTKAIFASPSKFHSRGQRRDVQNAKQASLVDSDEQLDTSLLDIVDFDENAVDYNLLQQAISEPLPLSSSDILLLTNAAAGGSRHHGQSVGYSQQNVVPEVGTQSVRQNGSDSGGTRSDSRNGEPGTYAGPNWAVQAGGFTPPKAVGIHFNCHSTPSTVCSSMVIPILQSEDSTHSVSELSGRQAKQAQSNQRNLNASLNQSISSQLNTSMSPSQSNRPTPTKVRIVFNEKTNQFTINRLRMLVSPPNVVDSGFVSVSSAASVSVANASSSTFGAAHRPSVAIANLPTGTTATTLGTTTTSAHMSTAPTSQPGHSSAFLSSVSVLGNRKSMISSNESAVSATQNGQCGNDSVRPISTGDNVMTSVTQFDNQSCAFESKTATGGHILFGRSISTAACDQLDVLNTTALKSTDVSSSRLTSTPVTNKSSTRRTSTSSANASHFDRTCSSRVATRDHTMNGVDSSPMPNLLARSFAHDVDIVTPSKTVSNVDELIHGSIVASFSEVIGSSSMLMTPFKTPLKPASRTVTPMLVADAVDGSVLVDGSVHEQSLANQSGAGSRARRRLMDDYIFANVSRSDAATDRHSVSFPVASVDQVQPYLNASVNSSQLQHLGDTTANSQPSARSLKRDRVGIVWRSAASGNSTDQRIMTQLARRFSHSVSAAPLNLATRRASVSTYSSGSTMQQLAKAIGKRRHGSLDDVE